MANNRNAHTIGAYLTKEIYELAVNTAQEMGPPVTKSGIIAFTIQTHIKDAVKQKRELADFCKKREDRKNRFRDFLVNSGEINSKNGHLAEENEDTSNRLRKVEEDNEVIKSILIKLSKELGIE